jgi:hypothetical protein
MNLRIDVYHHVTVEDSKVLKAVTELKEMLVTNQEKIDAIGTALDEIGTKLTTGLAGVAQDIQALKDQVAKGQTLDFTALETKVSSLQTAADALTSLDAENPPAPTQ